MIQLYVIMFVSGFQQVTGFCQVQKFKKFIQRIKLTACAIIFTEICLNVVIFIMIYLFIYFFSATFSNISAISWRPVLVVEEVGVPGENHRPWASNW